MTGLPADAKFSEVIDYWGKQLSEKEKEAYYAFFDIPALLKHYEKGGDACNTYILDTYHPAKTDAGRTAYCDV